MSSIYDVIKRPIITEKGLTLKEQDHTLCFEVSDSASKTQIQEAVERIFKVKGEACSNHDGSRKAAAARQVLRISSRLEEGVCDAA